MDHLISLIISLVSDAVELVKSGISLIGDHRWLQSLFVVLFAWLAYVFRGVFIRFLQSVAKRTSVRFDEFAVHLLDEVLILSVVIYAAHHLLKLWEWESAVLWVKPIWIAGVGVPIARFVGSMLTLYEQRIGASGSNEALAAAWPIINRSICFLIVLSGVLIALDMRDTSVNAVFLYGTGAVGVVIAFLARDMLANFIAGVVLLTDRPFEVGDRIGLGGTAGADPLGARWSRSECGRRGSGRRRTC